ncbi:MAG: hypothetical protein KDL87_16775, partial [Verrucomicrobiae bacterium]|nr:hypothetical protein [Verrucomicrobiae bacterium]
DCLPEAGAPRQRVMPDDLTRHAGDWDRLIAEAFPHLSQVDQPLSRLFSADRWDDLLTLSRNSGAPASLRQFFCGAPS